MAQGDIPGTTTVRLVAGAVVLAGALLLSGCTSQSAPGPTPAPPTSAESTQTPTPTSPAAPAALKPPQPSPDMERTDEAGAIAAAEYFMALFGYALQGLDTSTWGEVSATGCKFCSSVRQDVERITAAGGSITGGGVTATSAAVRNLDEVLGGYAVDVEIRIEAGAELDRNGAVVRDLPEAHLTALVDVLRRPAGWTLVGVSFPDDAGQ